MAQERRFIVYFAIAGLIAPGIVGLRAHFPALHLLGPASIADGIVAFILLALWPLFVPTELAANVGGTDGIIAYAVGVTMNAVYYGLIGALVWEASKGFLRSRRHAPTRRPGGKR